MKNTHKRFRFMTLLQCEKKPTVFPFNVHFESLISLLRKALFTSVIYLLRRFRWRLYLQSCTNGLGHPRISGCFPNHTGPTPPLNDQTMLDACIQNFFFQHCIGWGERELQENFEKDALFYKGTQNDRKKYMIIGLQSQDFCP